MQRDMWRFVKTFNRHNSGRTALSSPPFCSCDREVNREATGVPRAAAGGSWGSFPLRPLRRREVEGTSGLRSGCVQCRGSVSSAGVLMVAAAAQRIRFPRVLPHLGVVSGSGEELGGCGSPRSSRSVELACQDAVGVAATSSAWWPFVFWPRSRRGGACSGAAGRPGSFVCTGVCRRSGAGVNRKAVGLEQRRWLEAGGLAVLWRRCRSEVAGSKSKRCGVLPRPTTHIGKFPVVRGGALVRLSKQLGCDGIVLELGELDPRLPRLRRALWRLRGTESTGAEDGGHKDLQGLRCNFYFSKVFCVFVPGELSLWFVPERLCVLMLDE